MMDLLPMILLGIVNVYLVLTVFRMRSVMLIMATRIDRNTAALQRNMEQTLKQRYAIDAVQEQIEIATAEVH